MKQILTLFFLLISTSSFSQVRRGTGADLPAGMVLAHAGQACPTGFLKADGALISRATYPSLFASIGVLYSVGNGTTTFGLPDYRGVFLRGLDEGKGLDSGRSLGSYQADDNLSHNHVIDAKQETNSGGSDHISSSTPGGIAYTYSTRYSGGSEARPKNISVIYCVKF